MLNISRVAPGTNLPRMHTPTGKENARAGVAFRHPFRSAHLIDRLTLVPAELIEGTDGIAIISPRSEHVEFLSYCAVGMFGVLAVVVCFAFATVHA